MLRDFARKLASPILRRIDARIETHATSNPLNAAQIREELEFVKSKLVEVMAAHQGIEKQISDGITRRLFLPNRPTLSQVAHPFMQHSTCSASDFLHPEYAEICSKLDMPPILHRKVWEWVYVYHRLTRSGVLQPGYRGLGFGVGQERLPALFAKEGVNIVATDAAQDLGESAGWASTKQHSTAVSQLFYPNIVANEILEKHVTHRACDMNNISPDLVDFDFTWSCCCFEHLGSLEAGAQFVINSVEKTLKIGGVACHTTEFNLSSNDATVSEGETVLYRKRDMDSLADRLRERGHEVEIFSVAPDSHFLDGYVDVPPYTHNPHIKLELSGYAATSVGILVRRGHQ